MKINYYKKSPPPWVIHSGGDLSFWVKQEPVPIFLIAFQSLIHKKAEPVPIFWLHFNHWYIKSRTTSYFKSNKICNNYLLSTCEKSVLLFLGLWGRVAEALLRNISLCPLFILTHCIQYTARPRFRQSAHEFCCSICFHLTADNNDICYQFNNPFVITQQKRPFSFVKTVYQINIILTIQKM